MSFFDSPKNRMRPGKWLFKRKVMREFRKSFDSKQEYLSNLIEMLHSPDPVWWMTIFNLKRLYAPMMNEAFSQEPYAISFLEWPGYEMPKDVKIN